MSILRKTELNEFQEWLESLGWEQENTKDRQEVLRMHHKEHGTLLLHDAREYYTTFGVGSRLVRTWLQRSLRHPL